MKETQGLTYCRPDHKGVGKAGRTSNKYCKACSHKIRGKNHVHGKQHQKACINCEFKNDCERQTCIVMED